MKKWGQGAGSFSRGSVLDVMPVFMAILGMSLLMWAFLSYIRLLEIRSGVSLLGRRYMLIMETKGYLPAEEAERLAGELEAMGVENLSLEGSTMEAAGYGEGICLRIQGSLRGQVVAVGGISRAAIGEEEFVVFQELVSTAKN